MNRKLIYGMLSLMAVAMCACKDPVDDNNGTDPTDSDMMVSATLNNT